MSTPPCNARRKHDGAHCLGYLGHLGGHRYPEDTRYQDAVDSLARRCDTSDSGVE